MLHRELNFHLKISFYIVPLAESHGMKYSVKFSSLTSADMTLYYLSQWNDITGTLYVTPISSNNHMLWPSGLLQVSSGLVQVHLMKARLKCRVLSLLYLR